jgi:hypothetical protein
MLLSLAHRPFDIDRAEFERCYDREPFGFTHTLSGLDLFGFDELLGLARKFEAGQDYFVAGSAPTAGTEFYAVPSNQYKPYEALQRLDSEPLRVLLKRPEKCDTRFRDLRDTVFAQISELNGGFPGQRIVRCDSSILISSAAAITPCHFDPEITFFFQIEGDKVYHLYPPANTTEKELERFYVKGVVNIAQVDIRDRDPAVEHVYQLEAGKGLHQPQNSPHWVETRKTRSVSYTISFETDAGRALSRTRAFNFYQRRLGLKPAAPGERPGADGLKAKAMEYAIPLRKKVAGSLRSVAARARLKKTAS